MGPFIVTLDVAMMSGFFGLANMGGSELEQLIEAALAHAKHLRESANGDDDYGARHRGRGSTVGATRECDRQALA